ncbi:MAG: tripartite tricarboxylate transporter TctB family protein [Deltaproteobacteria bacterium]|nr:tripartite tricarboxylate transporter TctB family protein [Deltaproteobacteria bacterium]
MKLKSVGDDFWVGIFLIVVCLLTYFIIIPREVQGEIQRGLAPTFFPRLSVVWVGIFSLFVLIRSLFSETKNHQPEESLIEKRLGRRGLIFTILGSVFYLVLCSLVSFVISTIVILVIFMWTLGERRWYLIVAATLVTTFGIYILFGRFMSVQLPEGILF